MIDGPRSTRSNDGPSRLLIWLLGIALGVGVVVVGLIGAGSLTLSHRSGLPFERTYGRAAVAITARLYGGSKTNPVAGDPRAIAAGRAAYTGSCSVCHGAIGDGKGVFGRQVYPPAADLTGEDTQEKSDAELLWIIQRGLSYTAMPAFAGLYRELDIWGIVSYVRTLGRGQPAGMVPRPTAEQLAAADPSGDAVHLGASLYFAMNCAGCHGAVGTTAPGNLALRGGQDITPAIRAGVPGMPTYSVRLLPDAELAALRSYVDTLGGQRPSN